MIFLTFNFGYSHATGDGYTPTNLHPGFMVYKSFEKSKLFSDIRQEIIPAYFEQLKNDTIPLSLATIFITVHDQAFDNEEENKYFYSEHIIHLINVREYQDLMLKQQGATKFKAVLKQRNIIDRTNKARKKKIKKILKDI